MRGLDRATLWAQQARLATEVARVFCDGDVALLEANDRLGFAVLALEDAIDEITGVRELADRSDELTRHAFRRELERELEGVRYERRKTRRAPDTKEDDGCPENQSPAI